MAFWVTSVRFKYKALALAGRLLFIFALSQAGGGFQATAQNVAAYNAKNKGIVKGYRFLPGDTPADTLILKALFSKLGPYSKLPFPELVLKTALFFNGYPYHYRTLDPFQPGTRPEHPVFYLHGLDCVTLVDNSLAAAYCIAESDANLPAFMYNLQAIRYRGGICKGYTSRLHYTKELFANNEKRGVLQYVCTPPSAMPFLNKVCVMSGCRQEPSGLAQDSIPDRMFAFEQAINSLKLFYWPADKITPAVLASIQPGDVLGFTCYSPHLDIHHLGFAVKQPDGIHVLNASSFTKKVGVSKLPLPGYLKHNTSYSGIMAMRPLALRK